MQATAATPGTEDVMERYQKPLLKYATSILGDYENARDIVQETFIRWDRVQPDATNTAAWLFTVCRRCALDLLRKRSRFVSLETHSSANLQICHGSPEDTAVTDDTVARVFELLEKLPANQQEVLRLKFQSDLSYREIAGVTGLTTTNVGFLIHTGLKKLRALVEKDERDDERSRI